MEVGEFHEPYFHNNLEYKHVDTETVDQQDADAAKNWFLSDK